MVAERGYTLVTWLARPGEADRAFGRIETKNSNHGFCEHTHGNDARAGTAHVRADACDSGTEPGLVREIEAGRQREAAALQATADERRAREVAEATARAGLPGIDTKLLGKPSDFHGEDELWLEWSTVFRGYAGAVVPCMDDLLVVVEKDDGSSVSNLTLSADLAVASRQLSWMLLILCKSSALRLVMTAPRSWRKLVQRYEPRTQQRAANQLVQLLNVDLSGTSRTRLCRGSG